MAIRPSSLVVVDSSPFKIIGFTGGRVGEENYLAGFLLFDFLVMNVGFSKM